MALCTFVDSDGNPNVFYLKHDRDKRWLNANYANPENQWNLENEIVFSLGNSLRFSPVYLSGEFCFISWPLQPPSILPIVLSSSPRNIYFLVSSDFISQSSWSNTFTVSILRMATRTKESFSVFCRKLAVAIASIDSMRSVSIRTPKEYRCVLGTIW